MSNPQQIRVHATHHLPSGDDPIPLLGEFPFANGSTSPQGIHMIGHTANMPDPSLGTQNGNDGNVTNGANTFSSATGRFTALDTGMTITIFDVNAPTFVAATSYNLSYTVTYVSSTSLTLSGNWTGTTATTASWVLTGRGPSNAGAFYLAVDSL